MGLIAVDTVRHGSAGLLAHRRPLQGGPFTLGLETPFIRELAIDGIEVAQTITFSVRDKHWGTVESTDWTTLVEEDDGSIRVDMKGRFTSDDVDLDTVISVRTAPDGSLTYGFQATALRDFERARIGLCVMHPGALSGEPLHVTTPDEEYSTVFPVEVSSSRSISNIVCLRHRLGNGREVLFEFQGDLFEFEDQRNWTDASYKTFCTPLTRPWPVKVLAGDLIEQQLRISTVGENRSPSPPSPAPRSGVVAVGIDLDAPGISGPSIGCFCDPEPEAMHAARILGMQHVRISIDVRSETADADLVAVGQAFEGSDVGVELELVADRPDDIATPHQGLEQLGSRLRAIFVFDRARQITCTNYGPAIEQLRSTTGATVGGGSGSNFGAINFNASDIAFESIAALTFPMSPQVHYTDHFSLIANLEAQAVVAENGLRLAAGRELSIGPVTLMPRRAGQPLVDDPRLASLLGAAWTVASLSKLIASGANALTYHAVRGPSGVIDSERRLTPAYHVLADVGEDYTGRYMPVDIDSRGFKIAAVALRHRSGLTILVANLESKSVDLALGLAPTETTVRILDEGTFHLAQHDRTALIGTSIPWTGNLLRLLPFAVATFQVKLR